MKKIMLIIIPFFLFSCNSEKINKKNISVTENECISSKFRNFHEKLKNGTYSEVCNWKNEFIKNYKDGFKYNAEDLYYLTKIDKGYALSLFKESFDYMDKYGKFLSINIFKKNYSMSENEINSNFYGKNSNNKFVFLDEDISIEEFIDGTFNQIFTLSGAENKPILTDKELRILNYEFKYKKINFPTAVAKINEPIKKGRINEENKKLFIIALKTAIKNQNHDHYMLSQAVTELKKFNSFDVMDKEILKTILFLESKNSNGNSHFVFLINLLPNSEKKFKKELAQNFYNTYKDQSSLNVFTVSKEELKEIMDLLK